jgi:crotonobetainyl-CoA:carnitine CoA-transferase CaiB-like acyl-CoA transferase
VNDVSDLLENPQLKSRDFWVRLSHDELNDEITYPGPFAKLSETPITLRKRAPLIGEHNDEIYSQELHISTVELAKLKKDKVI